jgi:hypothetical protein
MNHEQDTEMLQTVSDEHREAMTRLAQDFARIAVQTAAHVAAFVSVYKPVYEAIQRDAERIGEETRRSISLAALSAPNMSAILAGMSGRAIAGEAFARLAPPVTEHFERIN